MEIKGWDKLMYKFIILAGAELTIDASWHTVTDSKNIYHLTLCEVDRIGEVVVDVQLKEGFAGEFYMTVELPQQLLTPNIRRVFRKKDLFDIDTFLNNMGTELLKNGMVYSYLTLLGDLQLKRNSTFGSSSISLPF